MLPARATTSINAYFDRIMNTADVSATMQCVRMPASFCCFVRSRPTMAPRIAARTIPDEKFQIIKDGQKRLRQIYR